MMKTIRNVRRVMKWQDRIMNLTIATVNLAVGLHGMYRMYRPTNDFQIYFGCIVSPMMICIAIWLFMICYRPRKKTQERIVATAMLLGMELKTDEYPDGSKHYYTTLPNAQPCRAACRRPVPAHGKTAYDVAEQWLKDAGH